MKKPAKMRTNGVARWWYDRKKWAVQEIDGHGSALEFFCGGYKTRKEAEEAAERIAQRRARQLRQFPAPSPYVASLIPIRDENIGSMEKYEGSRPSRTPYFYRRLAIQFMRDARRCWDPKFRETLTSLAKMYLRSFREESVKWDQAFGLGERRAA
jgi:hypothetical protein